MCKLANQLAAAWASVLVLALGSCAPPVAGPATRPAVPASQPAAKGPASRPASTLPPQATWRLDQIQPVIVPPTTRPAPAPQGERVASLVQEGEKRLAAGNYNGAVETLDRAVGFEPNSAQVRRLLGMAYLGMSNFGKATENFRRSAELAPDNVEIHLLLGKIALSQRQIPAALTDLRTAVVCHDAVASNPMAAEAYLLLGRLLAQEGYWQGALDCLSLVYDWIEPNARAYADRPALRPVVLRPDQLLTQRGDLLVKLGRYRQALEVLDWAYKRDKSNPATTALLMEAMLESGQFQQAKNLLMTLVNQPSQKAQLARMTVRVCDQWRLRGMDPAVGLDLLGRALEVDDSDLPAVHGAIERIAATVPADFERTFADQARAKRQAGLLYVSGELAQARGKSLLAVEQFTQAGDVRNDFLPAYEAILDIQLAQKRFDQVDQLLVRLGKTLGESHAYFYLKGKVRLARGDATGAVTALQEAYAANKEHVPTLLLLADAYAQAQMPRDAEGALLKAMNLPGDNVQVYRKLFALYLERQEYPNASNVIEKVKQMSGDRLLARQMEAELYLARGETDLAAKVIDSLRTDAPADNEVRLLSLRLAMGSQGILTRTEFDHAVKFLSDLIRQDPANAGAKRQLAQVLDKAGKPQDAIATWGRLYEQSGGDIEVARQYAVALIRADQYEQALVVIRAILKLDPKDFLARRSLMVVIEKLKRYDEGLQDAQKWVQEESKPSGELALYRVYLIHMCQGAKQYDKGQALLDKWLASVSLDQDAGRLRYQKVWLYVMADQVDQAVQYVAKWQKDDPGDLPRQSLVDILVEAKKYDRAEQICREWIKEKPGEITVQAMLLDTLTQAKKYPQAIAFLEGVLKQGPATRPAADQDDLHRKQARLLRHMLLRLLIRVGQYDKVLRSADAYLKLDPEDAELYNLKSTALGESDQADAALAALEKAQKMEPESPSFNNNLGYMLADRGSSLDRAERMIRLALAEEPGQLAYKDSLGWVFYKQGKFREAVRVLDDVIRQSKDEEEEHPVLYDHAGDACWRLGDKERAVTFWKRAIELLDKEEILTAELRQVKAHTPGKLEAVKANRSPGVAPLGKTPATAPAGI